MGRKAILFVDGSNECKKARTMLKRAKIDFVEYEVKEEDQGCCGGFNTKAPPVFAPEGIFKGIEEIRKYVDIHQHRKHVESESAYW